MQKPTKVTSVFAERYFAKFFSKPLAIRKREEQA